ncbi:NAD(P)H-dependent oxidoreductase subunit E [Magnetospira thiophila]
MPKPEKHVFVCTQNRPQGHPRGSCTQQGCTEVMEEFLQQLQNRDLFEKIQVTATGCMGPCPAGATVLVYPEGIMYGRVSKDDVAAIFDEHLLQDKPVERLRMPADIWG